MTLIVYRDDALYSDRAVSRTLALTGESYKDGAKFYRTQDGMAAMVVSGHIPNAELFEMIYEGITALLRLQAILRVKLNSGGDKKDEEADKILGDLKKHLGTMIEGQVFFMTSKHTFRIEARRTEADPPPADFLDLDVKCHHSYGSAMHLFDAAVVMGLGTLEAYEKISRVMRGVSPKPDIIKRSSLKRFKFKAR